MIFRNAGVPPALFPGKPLVHLEAVVVPVGAPLIVQSLPYRREPCFAVKFCLTDGSPLIYQREPDFSPAKKNAPSLERALAQGSTTRDHSYGWAVLRHCYLSTRHLLFHPWQHYIRDMLRPVLNPGAFEFVKVLLSER